MDSSNLDAADLQNDLLDQQTWKTTSSNCDARHKSSSANAAIWNASESTH